MNRYLKLLFISVIIIFLLMYSYFVSVIYLANTRTPQYSYGVTISTDKTLANVSLIIPMPTEEGKIIDVSKISTSEPINWEFHDWYNPSGWNGWNVSVINTSYGQMIKFTKDRVTPPEPYSYLLYMTKIVNHPINAYDPFQKDILIRPRQNHENPVKYQEKLQPDSKGMKNYDMPFSTYAYISYDNSSEINASVGIGLELQAYSGSIKHQSRYGWKWYDGMYSEYPGGSLNPGWNTLNGTTHVSTGSWRSVPAWVEILFLGAIH